MVFSSPIFVCVFLPLTLALYFLLPKSLNNPLLVAASLVFYAWGDPVAALLLIVPSMTVNFHLGRAIAPAEGARRRRLMIAALAFNLLILVVFKYLSFIVSNVNALLAPLSVPRLPDPKLALPLGISFFTFHVISYLVDIYRGAVAAQPSFAAFALYMINFPQLIAGPIIRYRQIADQLTRRTVTPDDFEYGVLRFVTGLAKKLLLADPIGELVATVFAAPPSDLSTGAAWLGVICYALQIYFDFSGYSDMAIGLARMFGFRFPENFNYPYVADSIQDFWRRWHMTLSAWFRDYVYIPLGGNRFGEWTTARNLWLVFLLTGAWHGASWNFIAWGLWHGLFLSLERLAPVRALLARTPRPMRIGYMLLVVLIGWAFFRSPSFQYAVAFLGRMFAVTPQIATPVHAFDLVSPHSLVVITLASLLALPLWPRLRPACERLLGKTRTLQGELARAGYVTAVMLLALATMAAQQNSPFLYFRF